VVDTVVATSVDDPRSMSVDEISELASSLGLHTEIENSVPLAVAAARDMTGPDQGVLVAGSLYVVGEARETLLMPPPQPST
jgi:dihydrofolate synthase/folylpolyglutamate synthase